MRKIKNILGLIMVLILFITFVGCGGESEEEKAKKTAQDRRLTIITTTQKVVEEKLKCPSTAKFPWGFDEYQIKETNSTNQDMTTYDVSGYVDAENSFGAKIRNNFIVKMECTKDLSKYRVLDVKINNE